MTETSPTGLRATLIVVVLALLSIFPPLATDMYLAGIGDVADSLGASRPAAELSLSLFFLGLCVGQLIMGPLIDAFGRKGPLLIGTAVFTLSSVALLLVDDIVVFNGLRFVQAIGACAGMVVGRAVVTDLYQGRRAAKVMTVLVMLMTLGPILAPTAGSLLLTTLGWRSIFVFMVVVGALALVLAQLVLPETLPRARRHEDAFARAFLHYRTLLWRRQFILPALVGGLIQAAMFAFITASPGVFQGSFGLSSVAYGVLFGCIASALVIFGQVNNMLLNRYEPQQVLSAGLLLLLAAAVVLVLVSGTSVLWVLVVPLWVALGMVGLLSANAMSVAMAASPDGAGIASAGIGAIQFGLAFATSTLVSLAGTETAGSLVWAILVLAVLAVLCWGYLRRNPGEMPVAEQS